MNEQTNKPTNGGLVNFIGDFVTDENNKVISTDMVFSIEAHENPEKDEKEMLGADVLVITLEDPEQQKESKSEEPNR